MDTVPVSMLCAAVLLAAFAGVAVGVKATILRDCYVKGHRWISYRRCARCSVAEDSAVWKGLPSTATEDE